MRVGVDATCWTNRRGFGRFTRNVVPRLVEQHSDAEYLLYIDEETSAAAELPERATERRVQLSEAPSRAAAAGSRRRVGDLLRLTRAVHTDRLDAFLFPSVYSYFPVVGVPTVVGVHDAIVHELPGLTVSTRRERLAWTAKEALAVRTAASVFTVSDASRAAVAARLGVEAERLRVVPEAPDETFFPRDATATGAARAAVGLGAREPYLVFSGGISPHKNLDTLLHAFARIHGERPWARLVIVGDLTDDAYRSAAADVRALVDSLRLGSSVLLPGYVHDETLAALYTGAAAVVIPSLAEGFGLPAVEGAACRAPLVLSDLPAHRETLDGCALFFPPTDRAALAAALAVVLDEPGYAAELAARGEERVRGLSWDHAVEPLRELITEAAGSGARR
jgi:glycosyltransferase involved in cell wall biosynthesis